jgi:hypothetical protein
MAAFLAAGTNAVGSADFTLASGDVVTLFLIDAADTDGITADAQIDLQIKSSGGMYYSVDALTYEKPSMMLTAPGTFRLYRRACTVAVGADKN